MGLSYHQLTEFGAEHDKKSTDGKGHSAKDICLIWHFLELINNHFIISFYILLLHNATLIYSVSNTVYWYFSWLELKWHNDLETRHPWIWIISACGLVDSDFTNDEFLGHYTIRITLTLCLHDHVLHRGIIAHYTITKDYGFYIGNVTLAFISYSRSFMSIWYLKPFHQNLSFSTYSSSCWFDVLSSIA